MYIVYIVYFSMCFWMFDLRRSKASRVNCHASLRTDLAKLFRQAQHGTTRGTVTRKEDPGPRKVPGRNHRTPMHLIWPLVRAPCPFCCSSIFIYLILIHPYSSFIFHPSIGLSTCLVVSPLACLPVHPPINYFCIYLSINASPVNPTIFLFVTYLSKSVCLLASTSSCLSKCISIKLWFPDPFVRLLARSLARSIVCFLQIFNIFQWYLMQKKASDSSVVCSRR